LAAKKEAGEITANLCLYYLRNYNQEKGKLRIAGTPWVYRSWSIGVMEYWSVVKRHPASQPLLQYSITPTLRN
jgi:hypothetical protein